MKRRTFGLLAGTSMLALMAPERRAFAQTNGDFAAASKSTLTPFGAERAGNADGSIPAWDGGFTTIPAGWTPDKEMPDLFPDDQPVAEVNANNLAQHQDRLTEGLIYMIKTYGLTMKIYPTRRTAAAPQYIYDNIVQNATRSAPSSEGIRFGFVGAYGGAPFPVLDPDPTIGGAQVIYNHNMRWSGFNVHRVVGNFVCNNGSSPVLTCGQAQQYYYPFYDPAGTIDNFDGFTYKCRISEFAPSTNIGTEIIATSTTNPLLIPNMGWELLAGQGRVRKTPELQYDTPNGFADGLGGYDEIYCFNGALNRYDWKLIGKQEMYIPYNNNKLSFATREEACGPASLNSDLVRWELHRVLVVEADLHPGQRNVIARRKFYVDEDTWTIGVVDCWDGNGNLWKVGVNYNSVRPDLPGTVELWSVTHNLQSKAYVLNDGNFADPGFNKPIQFNVPIDLRVYDPNVMAADASY